MQRDLSSDICTVIKLILVMPATNAVCERSFSNLTPSQDLSSCNNDSGKVEPSYGFACLQGLNRLNLNDIGNKFVGQSEHQLALFGSFSEKGR